ncbi:MAG: acireductone synthase [Myxococcota bacterium]
MVESDDYSVVLLDIEGTTTPVSFVYEVLFPYAQQKVKNYVERHWNDPDLQRDIDTLVEQAAALSDAADEPAPIPDDRSDVETFQSAVTKYINQQIERDQKTTPLKAIQGRIWRSGYERGELEAPLFDDVKPALETWNDRGTPVYIYSSGSVEAQKLLFEHTSSGDLTDLLDGYYDTTTGQKKDAASYELIAEDIDVEPARVLFITDNLQEAQAAREAGCQALLSERPGNNELPEHEFEVISSFDEVLDT